MPECYIEIITFPEGDDLGEAMYNSSGTTDPINFLLNPETFTFVAWHVLSPSTYFTMIPVINGEIIQLDVRFNHRHRTDFVAHFVHVLADDASVISHESFEPTMCFMELDNVI